MSFTVSISVRYRTNKDSQRFELLHLLPLMGSKSGVFPKGLIKYTIYLYCDPLECPRHYVRKWWTELKLRLDAPQAAETVKCCSNIEGWEVKISQCQSSYQEPFYCRITFTFSLSTLCWYLHLGRILNEVF